MKKVIFFILSTVFVLIIPNLNVFASTTMYGSFASSNLTWGASDTEVYTDLNGIKHDQSYGDGNITFSFLIDYNFGINIPYEISVYYYSWQHSSCTMSSITLPSNDVQGIDYWSVVSVSCPVFINPSDYPYSIKFKRIGTSSSNNRSIRLSDTWTYQSSDVDVSSITTNQQNTTNAVNDVNNSINNDTVSTNTENSSTASEWASASASDSVISDMVLMPITLLNAFSSGFSGSCQAYNLGSLYGTNLTLPCINISNYLGSTLWGIIDVLMSGFLIYGIGKKFVKVFNDFTNLKDSQVDELYGGGNE